MEKKIEFLDKKNSEEKYRVLFENAVDPIVILDKKGRFVDINKKVTETLGYKERDLIGKKFIEVNILTIKSKTIALKNFLKRMTGFEIKPYEIEIVKKNGEIIVGEINASPIKENRNIIGDMIIIRDITERKKAEQSLKESEEKYKVIFEGGNDGVLVADVETKNFIIANPKICEMTGYSLNEVLKLNVNKIHPKKDLPYVLDQFKKQIKGEISVARDIPVIRKDKNIIYCDVNSKVIKIKGQEFLLGIFRDITEHKKSEEKIKKLNEELKSKIEELKKFNKLAVGRELKMVELKNRIKELEEKIK